jgi:hypothetical protein
MGTSDVKKIAFAKLSFFRGLARFAIQERALFWKNPPKSCIFAKLYQNLFDLRIT